nr:hypothetical protein GCM10020185_25220 [Pseudomonas brassicacearum subsp. brassicacearum]
MTDFLAAEDQALLQRHGLDSFEALWTRQLDAVDEPNTSGDGWSSVFRLDLEGQGYYLKRQSNYLTRTLSHPFGEPSFSREFRNISRYRQLGIPALQAVFYGQRKVNGEVRAVLLTRALDGWDDLDSLVQRWSSLTAAQRTTILNACGLLARRLHGMHQVHGCFYPKTHLPASHRRRLSGAIDRPGKRPGRYCSACVIGSRTWSLCCGAPLSGVMPMCASCCPVIWTSRSTVGWSTAG